MSDARHDAASASAGAITDAEIYHRERAIMERRAATRAHDVRARAAHLELAYQHDLAQAIAWHRADVSFNPAEALRTLVGG